MKNKILFIAISAIIALKANAEYQIIIQLEPNGIIMEEIPLVGEAKLNPSTINRGESSNLSWAYQYANSVNILDIGTYGKSGSVEVSPLASRNYQIEITKGSQKTIQNAFLTVIQPNPNISFTSSSNRIGIGQPLTLNWNVSNAYGVDIDNGLGNNLPLISSSTVYPTTDTTFKLTAKGYEGVSDLINYLNVDVVENSVINSFNASSLNVTTGNSVNFSWDVTDSEGLNLSNFGPVSGTPTGFQSVDFNSAGVFDFTLYSTSLNGTVVSSTPININVYNPSVINSYTVNGSSATIDASPNQSLVFDWTSSNSINYTLNGNTVNGNSTTLLADSSVGTTEYILSAFNGAGDSVSRSLSVNVVGLPTINTFNAPTAVFINNPFNLSWTGTGISKYEIKSDNSNSGVATTAFDLGSSLNTNATPTVAGTYNYTLSAYNTANSKIDSIKSVIVEAKPTFTGFTVNGATSVTVAPNSTLTYASSGFSSGATFAARNSDNSAAATNPTIAPTTAGTYIYYGAATKTLNSVTEYSALRAVSVTVVNAPTIGTITAPSNVFANAAFTMSWTGTNAVNYKIRGNVAASGISTTDVDLGTSLSSSITPTAAGTYTYTITATNAAGVTTTSTDTVIVEANPTFTGFTVNSGTSISVSPSAALTFAGAGFSTGATLQGRNSGNTADAVLPTTASATAGTYTYYASATKNLNSIVRNSNVRSVSVTVVDAPTIGAITAPSNVFANSAFSMSWSGTNVVNYKIRGNIVASGVSTTDVDLGTTASRSITPTAAGTYTYTITATNAAGVTTTSTDTVIVEADPTFTGFTVNSGTSISVSPSAALTFAGAGFSTGAALQGRNSGNTADAVLPTTASATVGTYTYYAAATKTLNSLERVSTLRTVSVTVVDAPTIGAITAPSNVFANSAFSMTWSGTNVVNYKIRGNVAASGVSTTDVDLGTSLSRSITPTAAGTYIYTITATNAAGVTTTSTDTVIVEANPTFTGFTVNGGTTINVGPTGTLTYASIGFSAGSTFVTRNSENNANATNPTKAPATVGTYTYYAAATKTLNSTTRYSALIAVVVNVVETWVATTPTYTTWVNNGAISCSSWTPDPSTIASGTSFEQSQTCNQAQTRNRQERQIETTTGAIRNVGSAIVESQTITTIPKRTATGTKVNKVCLFDQSFNPNFYVWYTFTGGQAFWISGYGSIPYMTIDSNTGMGVDWGGGSYPVVGLTKISLTEFTYAAPDKTWRITRGDYVNNTNGNNNYKICVE